MPHCSCGACNIACFEQFVVAQEKDYAFKFLNGLNESFSNVKSQIIMRKPLHSLDEVYNLVSNEKSQRSYNAAVVDIMTESSAMAFQRPRYWNPNLECTYCKKKGHTRDWCFKLEGGGSFNWNSNGRGCPSQVASSVSVENCDAMTHRLAVCDGPGFSREEIAQLRHILHKHDTAAFANANSVLATQSLPSTDSS